MYGVVVSLKQKSVSVIAFPVPQLVYIMYTNWGTGKVPLRRVTLMLNIAKTTTATGNLIPYSESSVYSREDALIIHIDLGPVLQKLP